MRGCQGCATLLQLAFLEESDYEFSTGEIPIGRAMCTNKKYKGGGRVSILVQVARIDVVAIAELSVTHPILIRCLSISPRWDIIIAYTSM